MLEKSIALIRLQLLVVAGLVAVAIAPAPAFSQAVSRESKEVRRESTTDLDMLIVSAMSANPGLAAARARVAAARARIRPAGQWADPILMAGVINLPLNSLNFTDEDMTMKMIGLGQNIPYPGKLRLRRKVMEREAEAAEAMLDSTRLSVIKAVKSGYYELAYLDQSFEIVEHNLKVLSGFAAVTEARYAVGAGGQQDVLKAQVEATRLAETANSIKEQRVAVLAALNAELDRASDAPVDAPAIPPAIVAAAIALDVTHIRFVATTLGAAAGDSPLPPLEALQARALNTNPSLRAQRLLVAAQLERVMLARKEFKPDFDLSLQYGQRSGRSAGAMGAQQGSGQRRPDMISAQLSFPLRIHKGAVQQQQLAESRADLAAREAEQREKINGMRAETARLYSELERNRTQLAIYRKAVLPQGRAVLASAVASYQSGKSDLLTLLDSQNTLFTYETAYFRALADFARSLAALDEVVGEEVVR